MREDPAFPQEAKWLNPQTACEITFTGHAKDCAARRALAAQIRAKLGVEADVGVFETMNRRKKLLLADMDSTLIEQECLDELSAHAGLKDEVSKITERAMRGEIDFVMALRQRVMLLKNLPLSAIDEVIAQKITFMPGAKTLLATMKAQGAYTTLVSGGFTFFTQHVADKLGFDAHFSNTLHHKNGLLTGTLSEPILAGEQKRQALLDLCAQNNLKPEDALAVGDGANDRLMVQAAGLGLAFRAKPVLTEVADAEIAYGDLTTALYFQGYMKDEFRT